jgi:HSP20 family molecular chaperone IbpA
MQRPVSPTNQATLERPKIRPRTDVFETADSLILVADVPGAEQDSVALSLTDNVLTLRAKSVSAPPAGWRPIGSEFELPDYERHFQLTAEIDPAEITAVLHNGRMRVTLKKHAPRSNRIEVRPG